PCDDIVDHQVDEPVEMPKPAVTAGIVADLRVGHASGDGDDAVHVALLCYPGRPHQRVQTAEYLLGQRVRLRRGREAGDGPVEQQLVELAVLAYEPGERTQP